MWLEAAKTTTSLRGVFPVYKRSRRRTVTAGKAFEITLLLLLFSTTGWRVQFRLQIQ